MYFRICKRTQLSELMKAYCKRQALELGTIAFLLDGHAIVGNQTADEVFFLRTSSFFGVWFGFFILISVCRFDSIVSWEWRMEMKLML